MRVRSRNSKGQVTLEALPMAVILFAVAIISLTIMTSVVQKIADTQDEFSSVTTNDTTSVEAGDVNLTQTLFGTGVRIGSFAVVAVYNQSPGALVPSTSYTFTDNLNSSASFTLTNSTYNISALDVVYSNAASTSPIPWNISNAGLSANATMADFLDPIAVIIMAVIIIGLILGAFVFARRGSGAGV